MSAGRYAPSPSGDFHLGNLRTALIAWLASRSTGSSFGIRFEDLEQSRVRDKFYQRQLDDLAAIGLDWDGPIVRQMDRLDLYRDALATLTEADLTYPCYCTRREIAAAASAPHDAVPTYPGTCRHLSASERAEKEASGRPPAIRLASDRAPVCFDDEVMGEVAGVTDDVVLCRNDDTPAYNLAVVVDDVAQGFELVVRGDDLAPSTHSQIAIAEALGLEPPAYAHVPLVLGPSGDRLAKRDGSVSLANRAALGESPPEVVSFLVWSLGLCGPGDRIGPPDLVDGFSLSHLTKGPLILSADQLAGPIRPNR